MPTVRAMKGYGQFCPVAVAAEIFAERWTPLILRELFCGATRFNEIRGGIPLISRSLLMMRLHQLEDAGVVASQPLAGGRGRAYRLTPAGHEFREVVDGLGVWGQRWASGQFNLENLDVGVLMWDMRRRIDRTRLPDRRVVVRFEFRGVPPRCRAISTSWLILEKPEVDVCIKDPGFDVDLVVTADIATMARVWMGAADFQHAVRSGGVRLDGPRALVQAFPRWLLLSQFADVTRPIRAS
jgi:DNA-binding HxlR family transcriptional regulator